MAKHDMTEDEEPSGSSFDLEKIRQLVRLMEKHDLSEINLRNGKEQWRLRRGGLETVVATAPVSAPAPTAAPAPAKSAEKPPKATDDKSVYITAPAPGTFYVAANPEDPPFVGVGDVVQPDTTVCLIEAMKVFNSIPAKVAGTVAEVLVENGAAVEFNQRLFRVTP